MCCGQNRAAVKAALTPAANRNPAQSAPTSSGAYTPSMSGVTQRTSAGVASPSGARQQPAPATAHASARSVIHLRYSESSPIQVRGPVTGNRYQFSRAQPLQAVDARDASALLDTRFFRRA
jgi:hypothetical protein